MNRLAPLFLVIFVAQPLPAFAYLDPGSGSYIIQVTIGVLAGAVFMVKNYWAVINGYIQRFFNKDKKKDE